MKYCCVTVGRRAGKDAVTRCGSDSGPITLYVGAEDRPIRRSDVAHEYFTSLLVYLDLLQEDGVTNVLFQEFE